ncbi:MAG: hypothetical protein HKN12_06980, partial [Gemmatimonadetes bacterium]|nr:hypothetical protein [Gemmatimonadota bacterium]
MRFGLGALLVAVSLTGAALFAEDPVARFPAWMLWLVPATAGWILAMAAAPHA